MQNDSIISALIGLVGACNNNSKTDRTDSVIVKALAAEDGDVDDIVGMIHAEKNRVAPGCAVCETPCGNMSDYDMDRIYEADGDVRNVKLRILSELRQAAASIGIKESGRELPNIGIFYRALSYVSYDLDADVLRRMLDEVREEIQHITEIL